MATKRGKRCSDRSLWKIADGRSEMGWDGDDAEDGGLSIEDGKH